MKKALKIESFFVTIFIKLKYPGPESNRHGIATIGVWDQRVYQFRHLGKLNASFSTVNLIYQFARRVATRLPVGRQVYQFRHLGILGYHIHWIWAFW